MAPLIKALQMSKMTKYLNLDINFTTACLHVSFMLFFVLEALMMRT